MCIKLVKKQYLLLVLILLSFMNINHSKSDTPQIIDLLCIVDDLYGGTVTEIIEKFESYSNSLFEWNITTAGVIKTVNPCGFKSNMTIMNTDILISNITESYDQFECISIMPGKMHINLESSNETLTMIKDAYNEGILITSWCRAIKVLVTADILDGKNVTGSSIYQMECQQAGATFNLYSPPIRDGNLITAVRSSFYQNQTCELIAETCYEKFEVKNSESTPGIAIYSALMSLIIISVKNRKKHK